MKTRLTPLRLLHTSKRLTIELPGLDRLQHRKQYATTEAPQPQTTAVKDGRTHRVRSGDRPPLPLPPIMDPVIVSARQRYREPKHTPKPGSLTPFQKKLQQNPYGTLTSLPFP